MRQRQLPCQICSTEPASMISHMPHIFVPNAVSSKPLIIPSKPPDTRINNDNNFPRQGH